jgi:hypothetical protein
MARASASTSCSTISTVADRRDCCPSIVLGLAPTLLHPIWESSSMILLATSGPRSRASSVMAATNGILLTTSAVTTCLLKVCPSSPKNSMRMLSRMLPASSPVSHTASLWPRLTCQDNRGGPGSRVGREGIRSIPKENVIPRAAHLGQGCSRSHPCSGRHDSRGWKGWSESLSCREGRPGWR